MQRVKSVKKYAELYMRNILSRFVMLCYASGFMLLRAHAVAHAGVKRTALKHELQLYQNFSYAAK
jgi:hypothetical protein